MGALTVLVCVKNKKMSTSILYHLLCWVNKSDARVANRSYHQFDDKMIATISTVQLYNEYRVMWISVCLTVVVKVVPIQIRRSYFPRHFEHINRECVSIEYTYRPVIWEGWGIRPDPRSMSLELICLLGHLLCPIFRRLCLPHSTQARSICLRQSVL